MKKVELVAKTVGVGPYVDLSNEEIIAAIARHGKLKEDNGKLVKYLMDQKHYSPLQHISYTFKIETVRSISAQIFRHRSLNGQETSQRYEKRPPAFVPQLREQAKKNRQSSEQVVDPLIQTYKRESGRDPERLIASKVIHDLFKDIHFVYEQLLEANVARECARNILPMNTSTTIHISATLRDLLAFLNIRVEKHAQKEVRDIATSIGEELEKDLPGVFSNIDWRRGLFM